MRRTVRATLLVVAFTGYISPFAGQTLQPSEP